MGAVAWTVLLALFVLVSVWAVTVTGLLFYSAPEEGPEDKKTFDDKNVTFADPISTYQERPIHAKTFEDDGVTFDMNELDF